MLTVIQCVVHHVSSHLQLIGQKLVNVTEVELLDIKVFTQTYIFQLQLVTVGLVPEKRKIKGTMALDFRCCQALLVCTSLYYFLQPCCSLQRARACLEASHVACACMLHSFEDGVFPHHLFIQSASTTACMCAIKRQQNKRPTSSYHLPSLDFM